MVKLGFSLATSAITVASMWLAGNNSKTAWKLGLIAQAFWLIFIILFGAWGLLPLNIAMCAVYSRNLRKWTPTSEDDVNSDGIWCSTCKEELEWDPHERFLYCPNTWEHG